jgi:mRNA interferase RelE/StbE
MAFSSFRIEWKQSAKSELRKLPAQARRRILAAVELLATDPHPPGSKKLKATEKAFRLRVGTYRVIYEVFASVLLIEVVRVGDRKDVYR